MAEEYAGKICSEHHAIELFLPTAADECPRTSIVLNDGSHIGTLRRDLKHPRLLGIIFVPALARFRLARVLVKTTDYTVEVSISPAKVS